MAKPGRIVDLVETANEIDLRRWKITSSDGFECSAEIRGRSWAETPDGEQRVHWTEEDLREGARAAFDRALSVPPQKEPGTPFAVLVTSDDLYRARRGAHRR